jgi:hypothetical protein
MMNSMTTTPTPLVTREIREMRRLCPVRFPLDLLVRRPEEVEERYRGGDPVVREALDHGEVLHG